MDVALFIGIRRACVYFVGSSLVLHHVLLRYPQEAQYVRTLILKLGLLFGLLISYTYRTRLQLVVVALIIGSGISLLLFTMIVRCLGFGRSTQLLSGQTDWSTLSNGSYQIQTICAPYVRRYIIATVFVCASTLQVAPSIGNSNGANICMDRSFVMLYEIHVACLAFAFVRPDNKDLGAGLLVLQRLWYGVTLVAVTTAISHGIANRILQDIMCDTESGFTLSFWQVQLALCAVEILLISGFIVLLAILQCLGLSAVLLPFFVSSVGERRNESVNPDIVPVASPYTRDTYGHNMDGWPSGVQALSRYD